MQLYRASSWFRQKLKNIAQLQTVKHLGGLPPYGLYGTLTPEYSRGVAFDLGQQFFNVFVFGVGLEKMPSAIPVCAVQKPCVFLLVFLESGDRHLGPD